MSLFEVDSVRRPSIFPAALESVETFFDAIHLKQNAPANAVRFGKVGALTQGFVDGSQGIGEPV